MTPSSPYIDFIYNELLQDAGVRPGLRAAVPHVLPQVRHRDLPHRRHPQPRVPPPVPRGAGRLLPQHLRLGPPPHAQGRHASHIGQCSKWRILREGQYYKW